MRRLVAILALLAGLYGAFVVTFAVITGRGSDSVYWAAILLLTVVSVFPLRWCVRTLRRSS